MEIDMPILTPPNKEDPADPRIALTLKRSIWNKLIDFLKQNIEHDIPLAKTVFTLEHQLNMGRAHPLVIEWISSSNIKICTECPRCRKCGGCVVEGSAWCPECGCSNPDKES